MTDLESKLKELSDAAIERHFQAIAQVVNLYAIAPLDGPHMDTCRAWFMLGYDSCASGVGAQLALNPTTGRE